MTAEAALAAPGPVVAGTDRRSGTVYLLHLSVPFGHARHYTGFAAGGGRGLARRLAEHGTGSGARLLAAARKAGITWELARTWPGTRARERQLKNQGGAARRCPLCGIRPRPGDLPANTDGSVSRSRTTDQQKAAAGLMTSGQLAEHTALRRGAARGRAPGLIRLGAAPADDPWYDPAPAPAGPLLPNCCPDSKEHAPMTARTRRVDGKPETPADTRFFDLRESGWAGPADQDGYAVMTRTDNTGAPLPLFGQKAGPR